MYCIISYDMPHKKTQDLCLRLKALGYQDITLLLMPVTYQKQFSPLINHRPSGAIKVSPDDFCKNLKYKLVRIKDDNELANYLSENKPELTLIGGARILPENVTKAATIINSHPGYLPYVRGLDSYKWAIYDDKPLGVTTHVVNNEVDGGYLVKSELVPLYYSDTFHSVAYRQYDMEISMLANAIEDIKKINKLEPIICSDEHPARKRMSNKKETRLMKKFQEIIDKVEI